MPFAPFANESEFLSFFSTAAQALAALVGLSFIAQQFRIQFLDQKLIERKRTLIAHILGASTPQSIQETDYAMAAWDATETLKMARAKAIEIGTNHPEYDHLGKLIQILKSALDLMTRERNRARKRSKRLVISVGIALVEIPLCSIFSQWDGSAQIILFLANGILIATMLYHVWATVHRALHVNLKDSISE